MTLRAVNFGFKSVSICRVIRPFQPISVRLRSRWDKIAESRINQFIRGEGNQCTGMTGVTMKVRDINMRSIDKVEHQDNATPYPSIGPQSNSRRLESTQPQRALRN
jgi:hypothetical protein